ncbi:hypothetical protein H4R19_000868, partial [Coemansia spiralis]
HNMRIEGSAVPLPPGLRSPRVPSLSPPGADTLVFGVPVPDEVAGGCMLPRPVRECIAHVRRHGLDTEGLFRRSPPSTALRAAKDGYNRGQTVDLDLAGVHVAAVLLKLYFRELPVAVFGDGTGSCSYETVRGLPAAAAGDAEGGAEVAQQMDAVRVRYVREVVLAALSAACRQLLCHVCALLCAVARKEAVNRMPAYNLAIVFAPNMARTRNPIEDVAMCGAGPTAATVGGVLQIMVQHFDQVFSAEIARTLGHTDSDDPAIAVLDAIDAMNRTPSPDSEPTKSASPLPPSDEPTSDGA